MALAVGWVTGLFPSRHCSDICEAWTTPELPTRAGSTAAAVPQTRSGTTDPYAPPTLWDIKVVQDMDMSLTLLAVALSPTTIMAAFIIFGLRSIRSDLRTGMDRLDKRMDRLEVRMDRLEVRMDQFEMRMDRLELRIDRLEKGVDDDRGGNRISFEKLFEMVGDVSERVARIEGYMAALSFFTGAEPSATLHRKSHPRPDDQTLSA